MDFVTRYDELYYITKFHNINLILLPEIMELSYITQYNWILL